MPYYGDSRGHKAAALKRWDRRRGKNRGHAKLSPTHMLGVYYDTAHQLLSKEFQKVTEDTEAYVKEKGWIIPDLTDKEWREVGKRLCNRVKDARSLAMRIRDKTSNNGNELSDIHNDPEIIDHMENLIIKQMNREIRYVKKKR